MSQLVKFARLTALASLAVTAACAGPGAAPAPAPAPGSPSASPGEPTLASARWPARSREHLDAWLHTYALISEDTTLVPYFRRGYRERISAVRRQRGVSTQLDANRSRLLSGIASRPELATGPQFLPLYFNSWEDMRQLIDLFIRNNGNPGNSQDPALRTYFAILASSFSSVSDREWLRLFTEAVDDESRKFYHDYWTTETRARSAIIPQVDGLWQSQWRPALQRFLNNTQQQNGELYLSMPLGGEGRTIHFGKQQNAVAGPMPDTPAEVEHVLYVMVHEIVGTVAATAISDHTTPADRRAGLTSRFEQAAAVRAGALLLEKTIPTAVTGYMRFYLQAAGRTPPADPRAMFTSVYAVPDAVRDAISRQFEVILGGI